MPDIILGGETFYGVPSLEVPQDGGGMVTFNYSAGGGDFMGDNVVNLGTKWTETLQFRDTGYSTWSATTTDSELIAAADVATMTIDLNAYEYWVEEVWESDWEMNPGATLKAVPIKQFGRYYYIVQRRPSNKANIEAGTRNTNYALTVLTGCSAIKYYNTSGTVTVNCATTAGYSYGLAQRATAPTVTTEAQPTLTLRAGAVNVRCSSTYFATARKTEVNGVSSKIKRMINVYQVDAMTSPLYKAFQRMYDMYDASIIS